PSHPMWPQADTNSLAKHAWFSLRWNVVHNACGASGLDMASVEATRSFMTLHYTASCMPRQHRVIGCDTGPCDRQGCCKISLDSNECAIEPLQCWQRNSAEPRRHCSSPSDESHRSSRRVLASVAPGGPLCLAESYSYERVRRVLKKATSRRD